MSQLCSIRSDDIRNPFKTECDHMFCDICIREWSTNHSNCPVCQAILRSEHFTNNPLSELETEKLPENKNTILVYAINWDTIDEGMGVLRFSS